MLLACLISDAEAAAVPGASVPFSPQLSRLQWAFLHQARNQVVQVSNSLTSGTAGPLGHQEKVPVGLRLIGNRAMLNHGGTGTHQVRDPGMGNATSLAADGGAHCAARTETEDLGARGASGREKGGS